MIRIQFMIDKFYDFGKLFDAVHHIVGACQKHALSDFCFPGSERCDVAPWLAYPVRTAQ